MNKKDLIAKIKSLQGLGADEQAALITCVVWALEGVQKGIQPTSKKDETKHSTIELWEAQLEASSDFIDFWCKNPKDTAAVFPIPYSNPNGQVGHYFPEYLVLFRSGLIGLFVLPTSPASSDLFQQHNAFIDFMQLRNATCAELKFVASTLLPTEEEEQSVFRFCRQRMGSETNLSHTELFSAGYIDCLGRPNTAGSWDGPETAEELIEIIYSARVNVGERESLD